MYKQLMCSGILFSVFCVKGSEESVKTIQVISSPSYVSTNLVCARVRWADMLGEKIEQYKQLKRSLLATNYQVKAHELNAKIFEESTSKDEYKRRFDEERCKLTTDTIACKNDINTEVQALRQVLENSSSTASDLQTLEANIVQYIRPLTVELYAQNLILAIPQKPSQAVQRQKEFKFRPIVFTSKPTE